MKDEKRDKGEDPAVELAELRRRIELAKALLPPADVMGSAGSTAYQRGRDAVIRMLTE